MTVPSPWWYATEHKLGHSVHNLTVFSDHLETAGIIRHKSDSSVVFRFLSIPDFGLESQRTAASASRTAASHETWLVAMI